MITIDNLFPNQSCKECYSKIEEIHEFCTTIKQNEEKLRLCLTNDSIKDNYLKLTNDVQIKDENDDVIFCEIKLIKDEDLQTNTISEIITKNYKQKENICQDESTNHTEKVINEDSINYDFNQTHYSSDDEQTLSFIKKEKEHNINSNEKIPKRLKKIRPNRNKKIKTLKKTQKITVSNADYVKQFTCLTCSKECESQADLIKHYHKEHFSKTRTVEKKYTETVDDNITYSCNNCNKICNFKKDIVKHVAIHDEERPLVCKLCGRMYKTVPEIIRHARVHNGLKLECSYKCGYTTAYQGALKEHENRHLDMYKYTCEKCGKGFHVKTWYEQHQNIHSGLKPFVCDVCGLAFHMARYLTAHRSLIHPQSSNVKRYICVHCNQKCDSANSLALHLEEHGINKDKEFLCDFCGKILSSADQLKYHHRMHSGVKPYSCSICNKTFAKKFNVKVHMSSHSGEKTHACARCGKRYAQRSTLLRHLKRHHNTGTSPKRTG